MNAARKAHCSCGDCQVILSGDPVRVYACSCTDCRRATGSVFAYRARFHESAVTVRGELRSWRRVGNAGRWVEHHFCPRCGTLLLVTGEAAPGAVMVSVGYWDGDQLPAPYALFYADRRPSWCVMPDEVQLVA